jgi:membrane peptidoglycan carboxypeptidase
VGVWMGNSDNSQTGGIFSLEAPTPVWQAFLTEVTKNQPIADFEEPPGIVHAKVDAWSGFLPGPFSKKTVDEVFIDGTVPTKHDDTKVGIDVDSKSGMLWAEGCFGPKETRGFLDLSGVDAGFPDWQKYDQDWINRARHGAGTRGGPAKEKTATTYFYEPVYQPYGASWGAPFPPTKTCTAEPSPSPVPLECPPGGVEVNPDGTLVLDANGQPIPCPTEAPQQPTCEPGGVLLNPDGTPVLDQNGQPVPCPTEGPPPSEAPSPQPQPTPEPTPEPSPT